MIGVRRLPTTFSPPTIPRCFSPKQVERKIRFRSLLRNFHSGREFEFFDKLNRGKRSEENYPLVYRVSFELENSYKYYLIVGSFLSIVRMQNASVLSDWNSGNRYIDTAALYLSIAELELAAPQVHASPRSILVTRTIVKCNTWPAVY